MKASIVTLTYLTALAMGAYAKPAGTPSTTHAKPVAHAPGYYNQFLPLHRETTTKEGRNRAAYRKPDGKLSSYFPIAPGHHPHLLDGAGGDRGKIKSGSTRLNFGIQKTMVGLDGKRHQYYYALGTQIQPAHGGSGKLQSASGWVARRDIAPKQRPHMPTIGARIAPGPTTTYIIKTPAESRGLFKKYEGLKVRPNIKGHNVAPTDYVSKHRYANLTYNLPGKGGVSRDTFAAGTKFHRSTSVPAVSVPLYRKGTAVQAGTQKFVYGRIGNEGGWMAMDAIRKQRH